MSTDTITSLKEQIEKMETQIHRARDEKLKANNKVRRLLPMLHTAARSTSDNNINEEAAKISAEEKQQRIDVENNTIKGLASRHSKLRSELAEQSWQLRTMQT
jgi:chromosome segregation ATPase